MNELLANTLKSLKGLAGSGTVLAQKVEKLETFFSTLEPGDIIKTSSPRLVMASPIGYDLWYLHYHMNMMKRYYEDIAGTDFNHYDYTSYLMNVLGFLSSLPGLKPLKVFTDIKQLITVTEGSRGVFGDIITSTKYMHNGIYWINSLAFEMRKKGVGLQYISDDRPIIGAAYGSKGYKEKADNYVGYLAFPVGQVGVMETISLLQETDLRGYKFTHVDLLYNYHAKAPIANLDEKDKPSLQALPEIFSDMKDGHGNVLAGKDYCYGRHLVEGAYHVPSIGVASQNANNSDDTSAYAPVPSQDVELWAASIKDYGEDIRPKLWMRYWVHKDSTLPVPGEFIGILTRTVAAPPHVWWFQESNPFLYAGSWVETNNFTSGIITSVLKEEDRHDGGIGCLYDIKIQGCLIKAQATDFLEYSIGDRVAVMKVGNISSATTSFTFLTQNYLKDSDSYAKKAVINIDYIIVPMTFYKLKH
jgi:hypothetical protein